MNSSSTNLTKLTPIAGPASTSVGRITAMTENQDTEPVPGPSKTEGPLTKFASMPVESSSVSAMTENQDSELIAGPSSMTEGPLTEFASMPVESSSVSGLRRNEETEPVPGPSGLHPTQATSGSRLINRSPGSVKNKYDMVRELGRGRYGIVKMAIRKSDQQKVAIKFIKRKQNAKNPGCPREVVLLSMLMEPPSTYTVRLFEWFQEKKCFHLVMEYPEPCEPLASFLCHCGHLEDSVAKRLMVQIVRCAQECINHRVFHNDMHSNNILINTALMQIKLIDFGLGLRIKEPEVHPHPFGTTCLRHALESTVISVGRILDKIAVHAYVPKVAAQRCHQCRREESRERFIRVTLHSTRRRVVAKQTGQSHEKGLWIMLII
ncbi:serine/threonine-protein kinase pim-2 isoform X2 [Danio rerio]|uniref:Serine/threonine-protein kinase pim-2 isoform X2 n=1 Tax=Danio rerio TaxID=7955 RepID=A0AC58JLI4_DANRE